MDIQKIVVGDSVLVQSGFATKEIARVKGVLSKNAVAVRLSDGKLVVVEPQYIIKSFGR